MKTIAIVTPKIDTFSNPTLTLLIEKLVEKNYNILFFGYQQLFIPEEFKNKLSFYSLPFYFYKFHKSAHDLIKLIKQYYHVYKLLRIKHKVNTIICVDPMGLVITGRIQRISNFKIIYASFEIFFEDEFFIEGKKVLKELEVKYSENVDMVIIQDKKRELLLKEANRFNGKTKFINIPVSPKPMTVSLDSYNIYDDLNIPADKKIVIYSGTLQDWSGVNEMLDLFPNAWNPDFWLVVHSHYPFNENQQLNDKINTIKSQNFNITFHNKPFNVFSDYAKFLSRCHVGVATYFPNSTDIFAGKNIKEIGLSSGKFSTYMMLGIPTITTANSIYQQLNHLYNFGEVINMINEIPAALSKILVDYEKRVASCKTLYKNELDPCTGMDNLMHYIEDTVNGT